MVAGRASVAGCDAAFAGGRAARGNRFWNIARGLIRDLERQVTIWPEVKTVTIQKNWQELIRPTKLQVSAGHDANRLAPRVAEPLERGFGQTLGNALRRILL